MANKRIELEQYKHYVSLPHEEPPRKTVRKGVTICFIVMMLFCIGLFVLTVLSNSLATNPSNILEKPPAPAPSSTPGTQVPSDNTQQIPTQQIPQQIPTQTPSPGGKAPVDSAIAVRDMGVFGIPAGTRNGDLVAQASTSSPVVTIPDTSTTGSTPSTTPQAKKPAATPLPTTTKGAGSLAKLTNGAGSRGLQIYALVLAIGLIVILYLGMHRSRRVEGRAK